MNNNLLISVIIPTYNPNRERLNETINGLYKQDLSTDCWELIIVDNNSSNSFQSDINLSWHPNAKIIKEPRQGLTYARIKGFSESETDFVVMVDDDNVLSNTFLNEALTIMNANKNIGAIGGKSLPHFLKRPPQWLENFHQNLALRDLGDSIRMARWDNGYPDFAPIGAGMVIRKLSLHAYLFKIKNESRTFLDRTGTSLSSSGDNDIILEILKAGYIVGYFPQLVLTHIIPPSRMKVRYIAKLLNNTNKSWVELLIAHKICPWREIPSWSIPLRKIKSYFVYGPWMSKIKYIKWRGACGLYDGLRKTNKLKG